MLSLISRRSLAAPVLARSFAKAGYYENVAELIGSTPMVKLNRVVPEASVADKVLLKLEMQNPGGSIKDRIALSMIERAEARGEITPGKTTIVEATSGNTGIGLAMVAAAKGYDCLSTCGGAGEKRVLGLSPGHSWGAGAAGGAVAAAAAPAAAAAAAAAASSSA